MNSWAKRLGFRRPQDKLEWMLWIGVGFTLIAIIYSLFYIKKPIVLSPQTLAPVYIAHFLKNIGLGIIAVAGLVGGLHRLKFDEKKTMGYVATSCCILLFLFMIGRPAFSSYMMSNIQTDDSNFSKHLIEQETQTLTKRDLSAEDKAYFGKSIAREKYLQDGSFYEYTDEHGVTKQYQPTVDDIQYRESFLTIPQSIRILRIEMVFWIIVFISTITGSIIFNRIKR